VRFNGGLRELQRVMALRVQSMSEKA
jgi:hypothetical protein